ncbi:SPL family radical SAM protein [Effusibacillus consociatus]|uniref:Radical SAM protein n=1 Tax=Effusibacillus consociatus TaxID=1117041 RepID=A0ABV9PZA0_9BACL
MKPEIAYKKPKQMLNPASGYLTGYSHTLNPYAGCSYACSYCYVRQMPIALLREQAWGTWIDVKEGAAGQLRKELVKAKKKGPVTIFMSSSTDPYQLIESKAGITRSLLEVMVDEKPEFLFVQTRSPLVTRDIDLFLQLKDRIRISMTIETDREDMRQVFTPLAPTITARIHALKKIVEADLPTQATIAPLLPSSDNFAKMLSAVADRVCLDDYFMGDGSGGKRTHRLGIRSVYEEIGLVDWYDSTAYLQVLDKLQKEFREDRIFISQQGFLP